ncbi:NAD(P)-binding protein [Aspergillus ellipticus CBS 707.79]|uniref:NAD(P)-binding protein n=1 Tax=Aspergillus ellipticus CBS 707.79 TaxID=1448320 RepID=A0A319DGC5_9EURO|nr:NAD(P)-binding protein [Aspergillus ellipticus CBS 707.79]
MTRILLLGASGYIGGDVLYALKASLPDCQYTAVLRDQEKANKISKDYPDVHILIGDLDDSALLEEQARQADVVVHAASTSHIKSVEAISRGLKDPSRPKTGHWVQISGASVLSIPDIEKNAFGEGSTHIYSDIDGGDELRHLIKRYEAKRVVDTFILSLTGETRPLTALIFPPIIYGSGRGPINQRSIQIPELARVTMQRGKGVQVGKGESTWSNVHISDVSSIFVKLVEKAVQGDMDGRVWNESGLYFPGIASVRFKTISERVVEAVKDLGLVESTAVEQISHAEADSLTPHGGVLWGTNAQQLTQRARRYLGWVPEGRSLEEEIPFTVLAEAQKLGLK